MLILMILTERKSREARVRSDRTKKACCVCSDDLVIGTLNNRCELNLGLEHRIYAVTQDLAPVAVAAYLVLMLWMWHYEHAPASALFLQDKDYAHKWRIFSLRRGMTRVYGVREVGTDRNGRIYGRIRCGFYIWCFR